MVTKGGGGVGGYKTNFSDNWWNLCIIIAYLSSSLLSVIQKHCRNTKYKIMERLDMEPIEENKKSQETSKSTGMGSDQILKKEDSSDNKSLEQAEGK